MRAVLLKGAAGVRKTDPLDAGRTGPVALPIGDVAFAQHLGSPLTNRRLDLAPTIELLNKGGGEISHLLPLAGETGAVEGDVAIPHGRGFARAGARCGCVV